MTKTRWTLQEEAIIEEEMNLHQTNKGRGLLIAAERLHKSYSSVRSHWYRMQSRRSMENHCYASEPSVGSNSKTKSFKSLLNRIFKLLHIKQSN